MQQIMDIPILSCIFLWGNIDLPVYCTSTELNFSTIGIMVPHGNIDLTHRNSEGHSATEHGAAHFRMYS